MYAGFGRLASALVEINRSNVPVRVYSRTKEKVVEASEADRRITWIDPQDFSAEKEVWLFLPADAVPEFLKENQPYFHPETVFFYCATKGISADIAPLLQDKQQVVPVKFITEAGQLKKDGKGMAALPQEYSSWKGRLAETFGETMEIVIAEEKEVLSLNKAATEKAVIAAEELRNEMKERGLPEKLINHASRQLIPGVINSYVEGRLGGFGQQVIKERRGNKYEN